MAGEEMVPMLPWWRGFKGTIKKVAEHKYEVVGVASKINDTTVEITELPIHKWTQSYKAELEAMIGDKGDGIIKVWYLLAFTHNSLSEVDRTGLQRTPRQRQHPLCHYDGCKGSREGGGAGLDRVLQVDEQN